MYNVLPTSNCLNICFHSLFKKKNINVLFATILTFCAVEKTPYGKFSIGKSQNFVYFKKHFIAINLQDI